MGVYGTYIYIYIYIYMYVYTGYISLRYMAICTEEYQSTHGVAAYIPNLRIHIEPGIKNKPIEPDHGSYRVSDEYYMVAAVPQRRVEI